MDSASLNDLTLVMQMNTIGLSIIYAEFKNAAKMYYGKYHDPKKRTYSSASQSLAFIQGTGLDIVLTAYGLMYDADKLRNTFFSMVGDHERIK